MKRLRFWIAILSIWLIFFFNIERILLDTDLNIISSNAYVFAALVAVATLLLPRLQKWPFALLLVLSAAFFLLLWYNNPAWEKGLLISPSRLNAAVLITVIQVNAIILTGLLSRQITYGMSEFEGVIANITFGQIGQRPNPFSEEQGAMYREMKRARRYERPLAVMALKFDEEHIRTAIPSVAIEVQRALMKEYVLACIARILNENLQSFDTIALWDNCFIITLPEADAHVVPNIAQRLENAIKDKMDLKLKVGTAAFPDEAMTFKGLVELAIANTEQEAEIKFSLKHNPEQKRQALTQEV